MPSSSKIIEISVIEALVREMYNIAQPIKVTFLRRSFNDHYLISSENNQYILRVYLNEKRYINGMTDLMFELDLLEHLAQNNLPVAYPIKNKNHTYLHEVHDGIEKRYMNLFSFAEGQPIDGELNNPQAHTLGILIAKLHLHCDSFKSDYSRAKLDVNYLILEPIKEIESLAKEMDINHPLLFTDHINGLIDHFAVFPKGNNMFGIIHGDLNPSNIHYSNSQGFTFFDFDHCAFGWRIHDLSVIKLCFPKDIFEAVLEGYTSIRTFTKN